MDIRKEVELNSNYIIRLRKHFHKYPELGMKEFETSKRIKEELSNMEIPFVSAAGTGVIGFIGHGTPVIALRADMDALRINEKTEVGYKSTVEGVMHACGHDAHMAALLGAAQVLKKYEHYLKCTVKLIFQPSEENCLGAKAICDGGHLDDVAEIFGLHVFGDIPCGKVSIEEGPRMAASDIFRIRITGKSGHAGKPQQAVDATVAGAATVMNLQSIISREFDPVNSGVVTVGHFVSGTQHNIISGEAMIEGTARTFSSADGKHIEQSVKRIAYSSASTFGATAHVEYMRSLHPVVVNDSRVTQTALEAASELFPKEDIIHIPKMLLGEDFSIYQQTIPGTFAFVGAGNEDLGRAYPNHHECFNIDERAVLNSAQLYVGYIMQVNRNL
ncbi:MAG TPA: amidohydrolase [Lachnospiraceae bacterium]|nr:amidohydrolase [Lachnospiraceae bacterium]